MSAHRFDIQPQDSKPQPTTPAPRTMMGNFADPSGRQAAPGEAPKAIELAEDPKAVSRAAIDGVRSKHDFVEILKGREYIRREADGTEGVAQKDYPIEDVKKGLKTLFDLTKQPNENLLLMIPQLDYVARYNGITSAQGLRQKATEIAALEIAAGVIDQGGPGAKEKVKAALDSADGFKDKSEVLLARAVHEVVKRRMTSAGSFDDLKRALEPVEGLKSESGIYPKDVLEKTLDDVQKAVTAKNFGLAQVMSRAITSAGGLREATQRLIVEAEERDAQARVIVPQTRAIPAVEAPVVRDAKFFENDKAPIKGRMDEAGTWEDIDRVVMNCPGISGSKQRYNPFNLRQLVNDVRTATTPEKRAYALSLITSSEGLKAAVERALAKSST